MMNKFFLMTLIAPGVLLAAPQISDVAVSGSIAGHSIEVAYVLQNESAIVTFEVLTNGVPLKIGYAHAAGDVNHLVQPGAETRSFTWQTDLDWPGHLLADPESVEIKVKAWPKNDPPDYMMLSLIRPFSGTETPIAPLYYAKVEDIPGGITNIRYKTEWLAMRRIHARGVTCRLGTMRDDIKYGSDGHPVVGNYTDTSCLVSFTNDFYIGVYEFTQAQYMLAAPPSLGGTTMKTYADNTHMDTSLGQEYYDRYVYATNDYDRARAACGPSMRYYLLGNDLNYCWPEGGINAASALLFGKLRALTGVSSIYLPTSAQWEFACRAGCDGRVSDGSADISEVGWYRDNNSDDPEWFSGLAHAVGLKKPNAWGLYDMQGNAEEYCCDNHSDTPSLNADGSPVVNPPGPNTTLALASVKKVRCGGSFTADNIACGSTARGSSSFSWGDGTLQWGFRVICNVEVTK